MDNHGKIMEFDCGKSLGTLHHKCVQWPQGCIYMATAYTLTS